MLSIISRCLCPKRFDIIVHGSVEDEYILGELIGEGKTGKVYSARHRITDAPVAVKIIQNEYLSTDSRIDALNREINILFSVHHPGIIELIKVFNDDEKIAVVTELATGGEVMEVLGNPKCQEISEADIATIIRQIASTLKYLHEQGITHRDVKPENVIYQSKKLGAPVKLIDFGVAYKSSVGARDMTGMTGTGHYMAPEAFSRGSSYGCEIDLWSLGVMLYVMLFGSYPFDGMFLSQLEDKISSGQYRFPEELVNEVSDGAKDLVSKLIVRDISARLTAAQVLQHPWLSPGGAKTTSFSVKHHMTIKNHVAAQKNWKIDDLATTAHEREDKAIKKSYEGPELMNDSDDTALVDGFAQL